MPADGNSFFVQEFENASGCAFELDAGAAHVQKAAGVVVSGLRILVAHVGHVANDVRVRGAAANGGCEDEHLGHADFTRALVTEHGVCEAIAYENLVAKAKS